MAVKRNLREDAYQFVASIAAVCMLIEVETMDLHFFTSGFNNIRYDRGTNGAI